MTFPGEASFIVSDGWQMLVTQPGRFADPQSAESAGGWVGACVPSTAKSTLRLAGLADTPLANDLHDQDVWWRCDIDGEGAYRLEFDGVATLTEVWLGPRLIAQSGSMFVPFACDIELTGPGSLYLCCRALTNAFERKLPRARWRTRLVTTAGLRGVRTTLLGQIPSFMTKGDVVGPWRAVRLVDLSKVVISDVSVLGQLDAEGRGRLQVSLQAMSARSVKVWCGSFWTELAGRGEGLFEGELIIEAVTPWWPHTHGEPVLYEVIFEVDGQMISYGKTGFRGLAIDKGSDGLGFGLVVNGQPVFSRGACWVTPDVEGLGDGAAVYRPLLETAKAAGINLIRMSGIGVYEGSAFYELCDSLGIMVWQDFMFANFDYPMQADGFAEAVRLEADSFLSRTRKSPSLVVLCGGSEMLQQATMMGLSPDRCRSTLIDDILPEAVERWRPDSLFVENSPFGAPLPFHTASGVSHYFGVGAYMRAVDDVRRAQVRFTTECLAFSNLPALETHRALLGGAMPNALDWRQYVPRDAGADWDFEDVRDFYLGKLTGDDPQELKVRDPNRYHDLSCEAVNDLVTQTYWEWRRLGSSCAGALVWLFQDLVPGAGWGILDVSGRPKAIYYALKRVWQSVHLGLTDEGLNGIDIHLVNELPDAQDFDLDLCVWRADGSSVLSCSRVLTLEGRESSTVNASELIGSFFDLTYAYRFGPRAHDGVTVTLRDRNEGCLIASANYYPPGAGYVPPTGIDVHLVYDGAASCYLDISTDKPVRGLFIDVPGWRPSDDGFDLQPGARIRTALAPQPGPIVSPVGTLRSRGALLARIAPLRQIG